MTTNSAAAQPSAPIPGGNTVLVEFEDGIAWVTMNRPEKRNAVSPTLAAEMLQVMNALETDARCKALVLTGAGELVLRRHGPEGILPRDRCDVRAASASRSSAPTRNGNGAS